MDSLIIDRTWTLFLDRDGVINERRADDYVKNWDEFSFINGALEAVTILSKLFGRIIVVTNQRGVGKGVMSSEELLVIHERMTKEIELNFGRVDRIYFCTDISDKSKCRKPNPGMAFQARADFPEICFNRSIMIGDSPSDIIFGEKLGMISCLIVNCRTSVSPKIRTFFSLLEFARSM